MTREEAIDLAWNAILNAHDMDATLNDYACAAVDALIASGFRYVGPDEVVVPRAFVTEVCDDLVACVREGLELAASRLAGKVEGIEAKAKAAALDKFEAAEEIGTRIRAKITELETSPSGADTVMKAAGLAIDFTTGITMEVKE
jgi:hypothetical protein